MAQRWVVSLGICWISLYAYAVAPKAEATPAVKPKTNIVLARLFSLSLP